MLEWPLIGWVLIANLLAFAAFGEDKRRAVRGEWRLSEQFLLTLAALGGWFGAKAGQRWFQHKTRKQPFATALNASLAVPLIAALVLTTPIVEIIASAVGRPQNQLEALPEHPFPRRFGPGSGD